MEYDNIINLFREHEGSNLVLTGNGTIGGQKYYATLVRKADRDRAPKYQMMLNHADTREVLVFALFPPKEGAPDFAVAEGTLKGLGSGYFANLNKPREGSSVILSLKFKEMTGGGQQQSSATQQQAAAIPEDEIPF